MRIFSRLNVCVFVFLGVTLLFVGSVPDVHAQEASLLLGGIDRDRLYQVNDTVETVFIAAHDPGLPAEGVTLTISYRGLTDVTISNGGKTDAFGSVAVRGRIVSDTNVYIQATWPDAGLTARAVPSVMRDVAKQGLPKRSLCLIGTPIHSNTRMFTNFFLMSCVLLKIQKFKTS